MRKYLVVAGVAAAAVLFLGACTSTPSSVANDQQQTNAQLSRYQANQPVPQFDWSQFRQTAIDVESAQVHGVATTTFFFNLGVGHPVKVCSSIGFPMPSTAQLTNPDQLIWSSDKAGVGTVAQQEPNGIYTGDSSGTYVVCVAGNGAKYISYWEGFVHTEGGAAHWDEAHNMIVLDGPPTVLSKAKK